MASGQRSYLPLANDLCPMAIPWIELPGVYTGNTFEVISGEISLDIGNCCPMAIPGLFSKILEVPLGSSNSGVKTYSPISC